MRNRSLTLSALVLFALLAMASSAFAGDPPKDPAQISKITFETANATDTLVVYTDFDPNNTYKEPPSKWGAHATAKHLGSKGFWCAGSNAASGPASYSSGTRGQAVLWLPECYTSNISFWYKQPGLGALDADSPLRVNWSSGSPTGSVSPTGYTEGFVNTAGTPITRTRGAVGNYPPLSAGWLRFQFVSAYSPDSTYYTGEGPSIDDILVTGYTFGPVNALSALRQPGALSTVMVSWAKPKAPGSNDPDHRDPYYRVWRKEVGGAVYTELTGASAISATSFDDPVPVDITKKYEYYVQAYDSPTSTSLWGVLAKPAVVDVALPHFLIATGSPLRVGYNGTSVLRASLADEAGAMLTDQAVNVHVERRIGSGTPTVLSGVMATESVSTPGSYVATVAPISVNSAYRFKYTTTGAPSTWVAVTAAGYLTTPTTSKVTHNKTFTVKGKANRVPGVTRYVVLKAYQKKGSSWIYRTSAKGKVPAGTGIYSYSASMKVKLKGTYRVKAMLADAYNPAKPSLYRNFTAK